MHNRALTVVRLSVSRDHSTSPERQRDHCRTVIDNRGWSEVGVAEDLAVSATKYSPFQRPSLGEWLRRPDDWDTLVCWRLDRLVRSTADLSELLAWCEANGKGVVSATEGFDLGTPFGRAMVHIIGALGQLEAETTRLRVADAHSKLRTTDRWASGVPPLGFLPVPHPSGRGVGLATDPDGKELLHAMAERLINGWSFTGIARWLDDIGALTAADRARVRSGKQPRRARWTVGNVTRILSTPATQGFKMKADRDHPYSPGTMVLDTEGRPIRMAPPTFDDETWERLQAAVAERSASGKRRTHTRNPILGIGYCGECGASLSQQFSKSRDKTKTYRTYRCGRTPVNCKGISAQADYVDNLLEHGFLTAYGDARVRERVFVPGTDNRAEIEQTRAAIEALSVSLATAQSNTAQDALREQLAAADARLAELEADPYRPSRWEDRYSDETYAEAWKRADFFTLRRLLIDAKARVTVHGKNAIAIDVDYTSLDDPSPEEAAQRIEAIRGRLPSSQT